MTEIKLYNTKTRKKEVFTPINADNVQMYVCGPTVYDRAHLGNGRPVIVFDTLFRLLRHVYGEGHVTYARNFTDVDDRINETAQKRKAAGADGTLEELIASRADETIEWYHDDMDALGALRPSHEPRATGYIDEMIAMIAGLMADEFAYEKEGHVLFRVRKYKDYGALSGRSVDDMIAGARVEVAPYKEDPMDFVLWKPSSDDLPGWESPWGRGRPGWHIECSAMAAELLGAEFDIHGGGNDLQFPHHENEIAQSKCAGHGFANYWMHNEMLQVEGRKMSKSLGNFFTVRDLLDQGISGEVIRFVMLSTHYRKPMDWTAKKAGEAFDTLRDWRAATSDIPQADLDGLSQAVKTQLIAPVVNALSKDLNTYAAFYELRKSYSDGNMRALKLGAQFLGFLTDDLDTWAKVGSKYDELVGKILFLRHQARQDKDYARSDEIRDGFRAAGVTIMDTDEGVRWEYEMDFDPSKLEALK